MGPHKLGYIMFDDRSYWLLPCSCNIVVVSDEAFSKRDVFLAHCQYMDTEKHVEHTYKASTTPLLQIFYLCY
jgi:hypothetical protein